MSEEEKMIHQDTELADDETTQTTDLPTDMEQPELREDGQEVQDSKNNKKKKSIEEEEKKPTLLGEIISWVGIFVGAYIVAWLITSFIIVNARIPSGSMVSTINQGDQVIGSRLSYLFSDPKRGDIVIFDSPVEDKIYIKRLIGLPGDEVKIVDNQLFINGELQEEPYVRNGWENSIGEYVYKVPEGCYFMMGDNRDGSSDSRYWGYVEKDAIIAKAIFRYWPSIGMLE